MPTFSLVIIWWVIIGTKIGLVEPSGGEEGATGSTIKDGEDVVGPRLGDGLVMGGTGELKEEDKVSNVGMIEWGED